MHKLRCDTYASRAVIEVLGEHKPFSRWTEDEKRTVSRRQAEMRRKLGLPDKRQFGHEPKGV